MNSELFESVLEKYERQIAALTKELTELKQERQALVSLIEQSPASLLLADSSGNILFVNKAFTIITGYSSEEAIGKNLRQINKGLDNDQVFLEMWNTIRRGKMWSAEIKTNKKDGKAYWEEFHINPVLNNSGEIRLFIAVAFDITEKKETTERLKEAETKLKDANQQLKEINETRNKLFSVIGHDLRGAFGSTLSLLELINDEYFNTNEDRFKEIFDTLYKTTFNSYTMLENLLLWAKSNMDLIRINKKRGNICELISENISFFENSAEQKNISIVADLSKEIFAEYDNDLMNIVLRNLISNAIKFTHKGGKIEVSVTEKIHTIEITVKDEGVGIKEEDISKIFDKHLFYTTRGTEMEKGTGLGLLIAREFAEMHGGMINLVSKPGIGTQVIFELSKS